MHRSHPQTSVAGLGMASGLVDVIIRDADKICDKVDLSEISGKAILITGASGLIGTYLIACLKSFYKKQRLPFSTYAMMQEEPQVYLQGLLDFDGTRVFRGDLTDPACCARLPSADIIIHAAGYAQPGKFLQDQVKTLKLNTLSTFLLFEKLNQNGKFLFISSSEVYSGLDTPPFKEDQIGTTSPLHARACYIEAKRCGEAICNAYRKRMVDAKSARVSLAYGPGTRPGDTRVLNSFISKAMNGKIDLVDQGEAKRTYCYISDSVEMIWHVLLHGKEAVYNVAGKSRIKIRELAEKIGRSMNVPVVYPPVGENMAGAPDDVYSDMTKVSREFGKNEYVPLDEGLARTIEWQKILYGLQ